MSTPTKDQRLERYRKSPEAIKELYASEQTQMIMEHIIDTYKLEDKLEVVDIVGDIILGFYNKADLRALLIQELQLPEVTAQQIAADLSGLLSLIQNGTVVGSVPQPIHEAPDLRPQTLQTAPVTRQAVGDPGLGQRPLTREEVMQALSPKRTMSEDIATLQQNTPKAPPPPNYPQ